MVVGGALALIITNNPKVEAVKKSASSMRATEFRMGYPPPNPLSVGVEELPLPQVPLSPERILHRWALYGANEQRLP